MANDSLEESKIDVSEEITVENPRPSLGEYTQSSIAEEDIESNGRNLLPTDETSSAITALVEGFELKPSPFREKNEGVLEIREHIGEMSRLEKEKMLLSIVSFHPQWVLKIVSTLVADFQHSKKEAFFDPVEVKNSWIFFLDVCNSTSFVDAMSKYGDEGLECVSEVMNILWTVIHNIFRKFGIQEVYPEGDARCAVTLYWSVQKMEAFKQEIALAMSSINNILFVKENNGTAGNCDKSSRSNVDASYQKLKSVRRTLSRFKKEPGNEDFALKIKMGVHRDNNPGYFFTGGNGHYMHAAFRSLTMDHAEKASSAKEEQLIAPSQQDNKVYAYCTLTSDAREHLSKHVPVPALGDFLTQEACLNPSTLYDHELDRYLEYYMRLSPHLDFHNFSESSEKHSYAAFLALFIESPTLAYSDRSTIGNFQKIAHAVLNIAGKYKAVVDPPTYSHTTEKYLLSVGGDRLQSGMIDIAVIMAHELRDSLNSLGFNVKIAVAEGPILRHSVGDEAGYQHLNFFGSEVIETFRMASQSKKLNNIFLSPSVRQFIGDRAECTDTGSFSFKGFERNRQVFVLDRLKNIHPLLASSVRSSEVLFSDRSDLEKIEQTLADGMPLCIEGPPGCGKTTLVRQHIQEHCSSYAMCVPVDILHYHRERHYMILGLLERMIESCSNMQENGAEHKTLQEMSPDERNKALEEAFLRSAKELTENQKNALRYMLNMTEQKTREVLEDIPSAFMSLVEGLAEKAGKPILLCVENADSAILEKDKSSSDSLYAILMRAHNNPLCRMIITKHFSPRQEKQQWEESAFVDRHTMKGLSYDDCKTFIQGLVEQEYGKDISLIAASNRDDCVFLADLCSHNPLFLQQAFRQLVDQELFISSPFPNTLELAEGVRKKEIALKFGLGSILDPIKEFKDTKNAHLKELKNFIDHCAFFERNLCCSDLHAVFPDVYRDEDLLQRLFAQSCDMGILQYVPESNSYQFTSHVFIDELQRQFETDPRFTHHSMIAKHFMQQQDWQRAYHHFMKAFNNKKEATIKALLETELVDSPLVNDFLTTCWQFVLDCEKHFDIPQVIECCEHLRLMQKHLPLDVPYKDVLIKLARFYRLNAKIQVSLDCYKELANIELDFYEKIEVLMQHGLLYRKLLLSKEIVREMHTLYEFAFSYLETKKERLKDDPSFKRCAYYFEDFLTLLQFNDAQFFSSTPPHLLAPFQKTQYLLLQRVRQDYDKDKKFFKETMIRTLSNLCIISSAIGNISHAVTFGEEAYALCEEIMRQGLESVDQADLIANIADTLMRAYHKNDSPQPEKFDVLLRLLPLSRYAVIKCLVMLGELYCDFEDTRPNRKPIELHAIEDKRKIELLAFYAAQRGDFIEKTVVSLANLIECDDQLLKRGVSTLPTEKVAQLRKEIKNYLPLLGKKLVEFPTFSVPALIAQRGEITDFYHRISKEYQYLL